MTPQPSVRVDLPGTAADRDAYDLLERAFSQEAGGPRPFPSVAAQVVAAAVAPSFLRAELRPLLLLLADNVGFDAAPDGGYVWLDDEPRARVELEIALPQSCADAFEARRSSLVRRWLIPRRIAFDTFVWLALRTAALAVRLDPGLPARLLALRPADALSSPEVGPRLS